MTVHRSRAALGFSAAAALLVGLSVYSLDRGPGAAQWVPPLGVAAVPGLLGAAGGWVPSAVHAYAFSVLTVLAIGPVTTRCAIATCAAWALVDALAECVQHPALAPHALQALAGLPGALPLLRYVAGGTFDARDVLAAAGGALLAATVLCNVHRHPRRGDPRHG